MGIIKGLPEEIRGEFSEEIFGGLLELCWAWALLETSEDILEEFPIEDGVSERIFGGMGLLEVFLKNSLEENSKGRNFC